MSDSIKKPFIEIDADHFALSQFDTKPIEGYSLPRNKETGEIFPNCCKFHTSVFEAANKWFEKFPECCEAHKKFIGQWWFKKDNYKGVAKKILNQLSYTEHHVKEQIKKEDWYKDIADYIEYNVASFGHPAVRLHLYLENLRHAIEHAGFDIEQEKKTDLLKYIDSFYKIDRNEPPDLNLLYQTYNEWLKIFPFELNSYFGNLKDHYSKTLPILKEKPEYNKYTGLSKAKMHSKETLIKFLIDFTNDLLTQINGVTLYEKGLITDVKKIKLDLIINSRKQKLKDGYSYNAPDEKTQIKKMIKYWFEDEKKFIEEITPLLRPKTEEQKQENQINWIQVFEELKIDEQIKTEAYRTTSLEEKKKYFDKASHKLTLQYLLKLKQEVYLLSPARQLAYLKSLDIKPPKRGTSESATFNQTVFEAQYNYYDFVQSYMRKLSNEIQTPSDQESKATNEFDSIFTIPNWEKYVNALINCEPPLLDQSFQFIGNKKIHRGVIAAWFKLLKSKGIVNQSLNRVELATKLSKALKNYNISPASIDNKSELYESHFERQFFKTAGF